MRLVDTRAYVGMLKELVEQGKEVRMVISGSSMAPFLIHGRDSIFFCAPERELRKGDIVFYERPGGQFVVHRICGVHGESYDLIGDGQTEIEHKNNGIICLSSRHSIRCCRRSTMLWAKHRNLQSFRMSFADR